MGLAKAIQDAGALISCMEVEESGRLVLRGDTDEYSGNLTGGGGVQARVLAAAINDDPVYDCRVGMYVPMRGLIVRNGWSVDEFIDACVMHRAEVAAAAFGSRASRYEHDGRHVDVIDSGWTRVDHIARRARNALQDGGRWADLYLDTPGAQGSIESHIDTVMAASVPENVPMSEIDEFLSTEAGLAAYECALADSYHQVGETPLSNLYEVARTAIAQSRADALKENLPDVLMLGAMKVIAEHGGVAVDDMFVDILSENFADVMLDEPEKAISEALAGAYEFVEPYDVPGLPLPMQVSGIMTESDLVFVAFERANAQQAKEQAGSKVVPARERMVQRSPAAEEHEARNTASREARDLPREAARAR